MKSKAYLLLALLLVIGTVAVLWNQNASLRSSKEALAAQNTELTQQLSAITLKQTVSENMWTSSLLETKEILQQLDQSLPLVLHQEAVSKECMEAARKWVETGGQGSDGGLLGGAGFTLIALEGIGIQDDGSARVALSGYQQRYRPDSVNDAWWAEQHGQSANMYGFQLRLKSVGEQWQVVEVLDRF